MDGQGVAAVIEELPQRRAAARPTGLLAVQAVEV